MPTFTTFEQIQSWQLSREYCKEIFRISQYDGLKTDFALKDQISRSSGSIMDNIAEGYGRGGSKEFINFLSIAIGSASESRSQVHRIYDRNYITENEYNNLLASIQEIINKIGALITYLKSSDYKGVKFK